MSDVWLNLRIGNYHLQAGRFEWWRLSLRFNPYQAEIKDKPFLELIELTWPKSYKGGRAATND